MISLTDTQKIGMGLTGFGVFFLFFGMILFFDKALLAIGNVLFVAGLAFVIGLERTFRFFFQKHKMKATGFFLGGVFVVLIGWPLIGMIFEIYGFFLLFRGFFPVVVGFIRRVPVLGSLLNLPGIRSFVDKVGESNNMGAKSLTAATLALLLMFSVLGNSAPQKLFNRRNWTPQAMLYLKGAQGRRFISDQSRRKDLSDRLPPGE
ncbi:vesicle transport protein GOT1B [Marmota monax]|uniref:Vesicle transport protein GOT1B n=1 Tax=Marmota monax TaxID=9995 RepID=A0A834PLF6_MARMO|nr:vesicle transport protein GOT1B [Marmota monax]